MVGDHGAAVHLRAGAHHREHAANGDDLVAGRLHAQEILLPGILIAPGGDGNGFRIVAYAAAADGEDEVDVVVAYDRAALVEFLDGRVGHDARNLENGFSSGVCNGDDLVVQPRTLDGAASVGERYVRPVRGELGFKAVEGVLAEMKFSRVVVGEVSQHGSSVLPPSVGGVSFGCGRPRRPGGRACACVLSPFSATI